MLFRYMSVAQTTTKSLFFHIFGPAESDVLHRMILERKKADPEHWSLLH